MRPLAFQVAMVSEDNPSGEMLWVLASVWALAGEGGLSSCGPGSEGMV